MSERHLSFLRVAATAATFWMPFSAGAQTLAAIAPMSLSPSPSTQMGAPSASSGDASSLREAPLKVAAEHVLETHCARCHQADRLVGRSKPAKGLGNILDLDALATNPQYVKPGDADRSLLYHVIVRREMPSDVFTDGDMDHPVPDDGDMKALRAWITNLDGAAPPPVENVQVASLPRAKDLGNVQSDSSRVSAGSSDGSKSAPLVSSQGTDRPVAPTAPAAPQTQTVVAAKETGSAADDAAHELIVNAQRNLKRLGCYVGELNGVADADTNAAIGHYNGIMGRGVQTSAVTSDMIEEMQSESGSICASRPILPAPSADAGDDDREPSNAVHPHPSNNDKRDAKAAHHQVTPPKTRVAHEPADRKAAPARRTAHEPHMREPSYRQAQHQPSYRQAERSSGGGGGGGGSSTVSGINGI